jgi:hypothetical protein
MAWHLIAERAQSSIFDIEVSCFDPMEHQRRVEARISDVPGLTSPAWLSVQQHEYEPWLMKRLVVDTAILSPSNALSLIELHLDGNGN